MPSAVDSRVARNSETEYRSSFARSASCICLRPASTASNSATPCRSDTNSSGGAAAGLFWLSMSNQSGQHRSILGGFAGRLQSAISRRRQTAYLRSAARCWGTAPRFRHVAARSLDFAWDPGPSRHARGPEPVEGLVLKTPWPRWGQRAPPMSLHSERFKEWRAARKMAFANTVAARWRTTSSRCCFKMTARTRSCRSRPGRKNVRCSWHISPILFQPPSTAS